MKLDEAYWQDRYLENNTPWQLAKVSRPLRYIIDQLTDKDLKILIPGAGNSKAAEYLIDSGFRNITVLDIAALPLENLKKSFGANDSIRFIKDDYFSHEGTYDLIVEQTFFCALESRFRESYPKKSHELLSVNGTIRGVLFDFESDRDAPPYGGNEGEYRRLFEPYFNIDTLEPCQFSEDSRQGKELLINFRK